MKILQVVMKIKPLFYRTRIATDGLCVRMLQQLLEPQANYVFVDAYVMLAVRLGTSSELQSQLLTEYVKLQWTFTKIKVAKFWPP